ncbi:MAG: MBL fold metallo-hydrolase [Acidimicrobiia bacterium]|nr:MBL fold metallo-hydrolase [Acidimicrobiia bacterium]
MRLTVLGCNGTYPTPGRPASGYLVETDHARIWMDAGSGTFAALQDVIPADSIDAIILTHEHSDHCLDIFGFAYARRYGSPDLPAVPTFAPSAVRDRLKAFIGREGSAVFEALEFRPVDGLSVVEFDDLTVSFCPTNHPVPTVAVRVRHGDQIYGYTSDTGVDPDLVGFFEDADALLIEASYQGHPSAKPWPHHLTATEAGSLARLAGVRRPILTHLWPTLDPRVSAAEAATGYGGEVEVAGPGMIIEEAM